MQIDKRSKSLAAYFLGALALVSAAGCGDYDEVIQPPPPATGEGYVTTETFFGDRQSWSEVSGMAEGFGDELLVWGIQYDEGLVATSTSSFQFLSSFGEFTPTSAHALDPNFIVVAGYDGSLGDPATAHINTYNAQGTSLSGAEHGLQGGRIWFNDAVVLSNLTPARVVAVGGGGIGSERAPFLSRIEVQPNGELDFQKWGQTLFDDVLAGASFWNIASLSDGTLVVAGPNDGVEDAHIWSLDDSLVVQPVVEVGRHATVEDLLIDLDEIYVVGEYDLAVSGQHTSGLIARYSIDGQQRWKKQIDVSEASEAYYACALGGGQLFAVGYAGSFWVPETQRTYGQALLTIVDAATGEIISHHTFGDPAVRSWFSSVIVSGAQSFCGGVTNYPIQRGSAQGWLAAIDLASMAASTPAPILSAGSMPAPPAPRSRR